MRKNIGAGSKKERPPKSAPAKSQADKALGMTQGITRRDFLNATLIGSGALLLSSRSPALVLSTGPHPPTIPTVDEWTGYGGVGDYANSNGNTKNYFREWMKLAVSKWRGISP